MWPTPRLALLLAATAPLAMLVGSAVPDAWLLGFALTAIVLAAFAVDAAITLPRTALRVSVRTAPRVFIGEAARLVIGMDLAPAWMNFRGAAPRIDMIVAADGDIQPPEALRVAMVAEGAQSETLSLVPRRRGRITLHALQLRWRGPLGLNQRWMKLDLGTQIDVVPNIRAAQAAALHFNDRDAPFGLKLQRERGTGTEFDSLRDFVAGMDAGKIDWKHSARHGRLVGKDFRVERNHPVVLAFDTGHLMHEPIDGVPRLDHAINVGLLLGWIALRGGDLVGTYGFDARVRQFHPPLRGTQSFTRLQHQAAALAYHPEETNFTLGLAELTQRLQRRTLIVLFTDFVDTVTAELMVESLAHLSTRHVLIFVSLRDPALQALVDARPDHAGALAEAVVAHDFLRERAAVFSRLARLGVHCLDVDRQAVSVALINKYVAIKQRGLL